MSATAVTDMSLGTNSVAESFLNSLRGKAAVFLVADRATNLALAELFLLSFKVTETTGVVFDIDAFYASNSEVLVKRVPRVDSRTVQLRIPRIGASAEEVTSELLKRDSSEAVVVSNLNSLFHLFASNDQGSAGRKFAFLMALLSFTARTNNNNVLAIMYERERPIPTTRSRPFSRLGDSLILVKRVGNNLVLQSEDGAVWPSGTLNFPIHHSSG
jgi:hypothetical protein